MYLIVKYNGLTGERKVLEQTEIAAQAYELAVAFDAKFKVGFDDDEVGEPNVNVAIENENGEDKWQECSTAACPPVGLFN
jgi:hypothetical protein